MDGSGPIPTEAPIPATPPDAGSWFDQLFIITMFKKLAATTKHEGAMTPLDLKQRLLATTATAKGR